MDEVITDVPYELQPEFIERHKIDYVSLEDGTSVDPGCDKARLRGYDAMKDMSMFITLFGTLEYMAHGESQRSSFQPGGHLGFPWHFPRSQRLLYLMRNQCKLIPSTDWHVPMIIH